MEAEPCRIECLRHPAETEPASTIPQEKRFRPHARGTNIPFGEPLRGGMDARHVLLDVSSCMRSVSNCNEHRDSKGFAPSQHT